MERTGVKTRYVPDVHTEGTDDASRSHIDKSIFEKYAQGTMNIHLRYAAYVRMSQRSTRDAAVPLMPSPRLATPEGLLILNIRLIRLLVCFEHVGLFNSSEEEEEHQQQLEGSRQRGIIQTL